MNIVFYYITVLFYALGTFCQMVHVVTLKNRFSKLGVGFLSVGFVSHTIALIFRYYEAGYLPITTLYESLSFFAWAILLIYIILYYKYRINVFGAFVAPIILILVVLTIGLSKGISPLHPILRSFWFPLHVITAFLGDAAFALIFCAGIMYLLQEFQIKSKRAGFFFRRLPSLETLDKLNYRLLTIGFPFLTIGIITGSVWASYAWGSYWSWDPKEIWSLITWLLYSTLLHQRLVFGWRGKKAAIMAIICFLVVLFTFLGVNLLLGGFHSYDKWSDSPKPF